MENISKEQFLADVKHEIDALKKNALKRELKLLNKDTFNPFNGGQCIYGQLTGGCSSNRAKTLMDKCCIRTTNNNISGISRGKSFDDIANKVNKQYNGETWEEISSYDSNDWNRKFGYLSVLELYISLHRANNDNILDYLKGKTDNLILDTI